MLNQSFYVASLDQELAQFKGSADEFFEQAMQYPDNSFSFGSPKLDYIGL